MINTQPSTPLGYARGFTLIELMVVLVIFAMLALSGWQILSNITQARDRAKRQAEQLSQLQYTYLQLSQDFAQVTNDVMIPTNVSANNSLSTTNITPTLVLDANQISFTRLANPNPRYQPSPELARVTYKISDGNLIKERFYTTDKTNETPVSSVLLRDVSAVSWVALTPQRVAVFPDPLTLQNAQQAKLQSMGNNNPVANPATNLNDALDLTPYQQLPKGVLLQFTYHDQPIEWQFALSSRAPSMPAKSASLNSVQNASSPAPTNANGLPINNASIANTATGLSEP